MVYEISLRVRDSSDHFQDLYQSHRLVQTLLKGQMLDLYNMRDFVLWPNGLFLRISLKGFATLSEFFDFLKKQSLYPGFRREACGRTISIGSRSFRPRGWLIPTAVSWIGRNI